MKREREEETIKKHTSEDTNQENIETQKTVVEKTNGMKNSDEQLSKKNKTELEMKEKGYEYLDHTADIQIHSWGKDLKEAFEQQIVGMFGYMTELDKVNIDEENEITLEAEGHDIQSLLFSFMDEFLFRFSTEFDICKEVEITEMDLNNYKIKAIGRGEKFVRGKHPQGTEIKAITYSNMQIIEGENKVDIYTIVDI